MSHPLDLYRIFDIALMRAKNPQEYERHLKAEYAEFLFRGDDLEPLCRTALDMLTRGDLPPKDGPGKKPVVSSALTTAKHLRDDPVTGKKRSFEEMERRFGVNAEQLRDHVDRGRKSRAKRARTDPNEEHVRILWLAYLQAKPLKEI
ncbi:hypothetical protein HKCCSP123_06190 [Rhodobacterales bacterium HKCCSP123]|nr:hypothetical protein [Rhodobacterales bacterium HKCCSP123]